MRRHAGTTTPARDSALNQISHTAWACNSAASEVSTYLVVDKLHISQCDCVMIPSWLNTSLLLYPGFLHKNGLGQK